MRPVFTRGAAAGRPGGSFRRRPARRGPGAAARAHRPAGPSAVTPPDAVPPAPEAAAPTPAPAVAVPAVPGLPAPLPPLPPLPVLLAVPVSPVLPAVLVLLVG
ncbi:hypothetical protein [Streptomyces sp. OK228]|uniref:hypothetical protein n=1 Tax=Streptomyces sp. OK228 TaxID=1882786 RepID=UPI001C545DA2|nr:hypothetical protein [Streptomyces sp. OK228]